MGLSVMFPRNREITLQTAGIHLQTGYENSKTSGALTEPEVELAVYCPRGWLSGSLRKDQI